MEQIKDISVYIEEFNRQPYWERLRFSLAVNQSSHYTFFSPASIMWDGYVRAKDDFSVKESEGDCYVYVWRHMFGNPFYIGSGKGDRWTQKFRNNKFLQELDKGDAVVYKVIDGIDRQIAFLYERYLSICLCRGGCILSNSDNIANDTNVNTIDKWLSSNYIELESKRCRNVEKAFDSIVMDRAFTCVDVMKSMKFVVDYGESYFSKNFYKNKKTAN